MKYSKKYTIGTGIGLQDVDRLKNSSYFLKESQRYIKGEITLDELDEIITSYYALKPNEDERSEEADKIAIRIAMIISEDCFTFTLGQFLSIHKKLFNGVFKNAGKLREYNFSKKEWILDGDSVIYGNYRDLYDTLIYDFEIERKFDYSKCNIDETINHLASFITNLWQIHAFEEGNTRTCAVFFIQYLRKLGFKVTNDTFEKNAWYFRNALVRANYTNIRKGIYEDKSYLIKFLRNLLLEEKHQLKNKDLHILKREIVEEKTREHVILCLMRQNSKVTSENLANDLNVSLRTVKNAIKVLKEEGYIKRENGKKLGYWKVLK